MLLAAGERVVHDPGARRQSRAPRHHGRRTQSDPRDARVIAEHVRTRRELRPLPLADAATIELRLFVGRRRDLVAEQTRHVARLHYLLTSIHPGLERRLDLTTKS